MAIPPLDQRKQLAGALISTGVSERETAKKAGLARDTVRAIKKDEDLLNSPEVVHLKKQFGAKLLKKADEAMHYMTPDKLDNSSADQLARVIDTMHKAYRRETGQSTENISLTAGLARGLDDDE